MCVTFKHKLYPCHSWNRPLSKINRCLKSHLLQLPVCCQHLILSSFMLHICSLPPRLPSEAKWLVSWRGSLDTVNRIACSRLHSRQTKWTWTAASLTPLSPWQLSDLTPIGLVSSNSLHTVMGQDKQSNMLWISKSLLLNSWLAE